MNNEKSRILIVDDEDAARYGMRKALGKTRYIIEEAENGRVALEKLAEFKPDLVLCDINMPEMNGLEFIYQLQKQEGEGGFLPLVIVLTAFGSEKIAVDAMKAGAYDYLSKPFEIEELRLVVNKALDKINLGRENVLLRQQLAGQTRGKIIGESQKILDVLKLIDKVAPTDITVLLTGESGTGKELAAKTIHSYSARATGPFITMNCAAIPKDLVESELFGHEKGAYTGAINQRQGKFEIANGGTLFLDEIADMSIDTQAKILRILEEKAFTRLGGKKMLQTDVRLISATNKNLRKEIEEGRFREDLYYRIKVVEIQLPALRERKIDIPVLANHYMQVYAEKHAKNIQAFDSAAMQLLLDYDWPGNVRQFIHVLEQCVVLAEKPLITVDLLPPELVKTPQNLLNLAPGDVSFSNAKDLVIREFEWSMIDKALKMTLGNVSQAAKLLEMKRQFLQQKIRNLQINPLDYKNDRSHNNRH